MMAAFGSLIPRELLNMARDLDIYHVRAKARGVARPKAEQILAEEMEKAKASRTYTSSDALKTASRRLAQEA